MHEGIHNIWWMRSIVSCVPCNNGTMMIIIIIAIIIIIVLAILFWNVLHPAT